ncbi:hypothetical protein JCM10213_005517 [Rhodosporidiobolus nylandii]
MLARLARPRAFPLHLAAGRLQLVNRTAAPVRRSPPSPLYRAATRGYNTSQTSSAFSPTLRRIAREGADFVAIVAAGLAMYTVGLGLGWVLSALGEASMSWEGTSELRIKLDKVERELRNEIREEASRARDAALKLDMGLNERHLAYLELRSRVADLERAEMKRAAKQAAGAQQ